MIFDYLYGNAIDEAQAKLNYFKLKKAKRLYSKIGKEIQNLEKSVSGYLESKFVQCSLEFKEPDKITDKAQ
ncbi:MAG: hypothetical protein KGZ97_12110 [Bacteroidetes bacterium]|nr:hypothetical protein [Bacteroidota bacterium]